MPGYDTERFVNLSENDIAELSCGICRDILCNPLVTQCCLQTFCRDCITDWLKNNNYCPYDRIPMKSQGLSRPPRIMSNMLGKLEIQCQFKENGCNEILLLENLSRHTDNCRYDICKKCLCLIQDKSSHDCIKTLLELNLKSNEEKETLLKLNRKSNEKNETLLQLNRKSNKEKETLLELNRKANEEKETLLELNRKSNEEKETLLELNRKSNEEKETLLELNRKSNEEKETLLELNRKSNEEKETLLELNRITDTRVIFKDMSEDIINKVLSVVRISIKESNSISDVCNNVTNKLNAEFGSIWSCSVNRYLETSLCLYEEGYFIRIQIGGLIFQIYKNKSLNIEKFFQRFKSGEIKREIIIRKKKDVNQSMISDIKRITFGAIERSNSLTDISSKLKRQLERQYPGMWRCFIYSNNGNFTIDNTRGSLISFDLDSFTVTLFYNIFIKTGRELIAINY